MTFTLAQLVGQAVVCTVAWLARAIWRFIRKDACRTRAAAAQSCATYHDIVAMQYISKASLRAFEQPTQLYSFDFCQTPAEQAAACTGVTGTRDTQRSIGGRG
jgi:hypothetical protein